MNNRLRNDAGVALILTAVAGLIIFAAATLVMLRVASSHKYSSMAVDRARTEEALKGAVDLAIAQVWSDYVSQNGGEVGNLADYKDFIDDVVQNNEDVDGDGQEDADENYDGDPDFDVADPAELISPTSAQSLKGAASITGLEVQRTDYLTGSRFTINATAKSGTVEQTAQQTVRVSGNPFAGFEFAVLANNINCIMCHATFRPNALVDNTDPDLYGTFDRVKIAALESLLFRTDEADSFLAGSLYTRGDIFEEDGSFLSDTDLFNSELRGYDMDASGKLIQDSAGDLDETGLVKAGTDEDGNFLPFANLYTDYPTDEAAMTDGILPTAFPSPFPDNDSDRVVNDAEFSAVASTVDGTLQGGVAVGVPQGQFYGESSMPTPGSANQVGAISETYDGNLVLLGTEDNPVVIDGNVAVNGDVVLKGHVKGKGALLVRGNAYVAGDVVYADADGQFGVADDGTENAFGLIAGGSIMQGDYLTIRGKSHPLDQAKFPNTGGSINFRDEHQTHNMTKNGDTVTVDKGYFDPGAVDAGEFAPTMVDGSGNTVPRQGQQFSFTTSELMLFNNLELDKALADPSYKPRFYGLRDSQPNNIYVFDDPDEHGVRYDEGGVVTSGGQVVGLGNDPAVKRLTDYLAEAEPDLDPVEFLADAAVHYMNPSDNWISEDQLRQIWWDDEQARANNSPIRFDGLLYSNNAIFTLSRSDGRHNSHMEGAMIMRGGIIAADLGMLIPGGFDLRYDPRVKDLYQLEDTTQVEFERGVYRQYVASADQ